MQLPPKKENQDRYCDYHSEKGHYTNDCFQLKRQLEMALESGKLNHLIKDVRQRGRGNAKGRDAGKDKIINMIRSWPDDKKRKSVGRDESWMKVPIVFPPLSVEDVSDEPLIIEAVMEWYLVRRVYVDQGASLEVMFEHCFENLSPAMKSRLRSTQMDLVGFAGGVVKPLGKIELEKDGFESSSSSVLNDTLHDKVSHSERYRNPGHADCDHCRMPETGKEAKEQKRSKGAEREPIVIKEVEEWVNAGIIRLVKYPTWIANPILVKKADGSWRMCIDFKNLNSACPKDYYPIPDIDGKIESVVGFRYKCFLDAYKGYHQVQMAQNDEEKTAFYTDHDTYCYTKMPFGLKNAWATYQRLVDTAFQSQIRRNLEAYVDDMVIKSNNEKMMITNIAETFDNLWKINMKLNPKKCSFGVEEGKFLGYMVTSEGIRANPKKTKAIADTQSPRTLKEMQSLSGKLAALKRILSHSAKKSLPFFETLKDITKENKDEYRWTESAEKAFQEMKQCIVGLPLLATPVKEETLYVYLAAATEVVSAVLLTERK
ncbi:reverse transcriptase domain-containing protein [Tanacetum coccineum]